MAPASGVQHQKLMPWTMKVQGISEVSGCQEALAAGALPELELELDDSDFVPLLEDEEVEDDELSAFAVLLSELFSELVPLVLVLFERLSVR
ncbi:hypothetical protein AOZ06_05545 [Kibdelosporangium phytohabitans]|uniref:Uncharacterized protein n=1 Tax=Kibdelosporangium phytohabitans TaxID=860235 RepID=A0A0N9HKC3_9PSEU|nr:hypothetical protein AOZ06_05545 [Kibdelosporangium phytohabitans]